MTMGTFVISDIHGNNELFRKTLKEIRLKKSDKLILLGDLIDRGPDSKGVLDTIFLLNDAGFSVQCLIGNHEKMLLDARCNLNQLNQWLINGGDKTLASFLTSSIEKIPTKYFDLIETFNYYLEVPGFIFVHAALNMKIENPFTDVNSLLWERQPEQFLENEWLGNRVLVHGHNPQSKQEIMDKIENHKKIICVDNGIYINKSGYGSMCVLELENLKTYFFQ